MTSKTNLICSLLGSHTGLAFTYSKSMKIPKNFGNIVSVSLGVYHNAFVNSSGTVYTFGFPKFKHLTHPISRLPVEVKTPKMTKVEVGDSFTATLDSNGKVYTWGSSSKILLWGSYVGARHSLGRANTDKNLQPLPLDIDEKVIDIKSGRNHCLALSETSIYAWGLNDYGELGSEEIVHFNETPLKIKFFSELNEKIIKIEAGGYSSAALTASGKLYVWGSNQEKNLAMGDSFQFFNTPTLVPFSLHHPVKEVSLGSNTMMVMTQDDEIYATGMEFSTEFEKFNFNLPGKAESIFCGRNYLGVLDSEGNLAHFGGPFNSHHDLGVLDSARVMAKEVFPGKLKKVVGKFELVAGVSASECD